MWKEKAIEGAKNGAVRLLVVEARVGQLIM